tara:strand:+ start:192 stop:437 length:246 start_codon:yes stop_codon:yes gene_type:complete
MYFYTDPKRALGMDALPNAELLIVKAKDCVPGGAFWNEDTNEPFEPGFYWWACMPGCLPDSDPHGPFASEQEAIDYAQEEI